MIKEKVLQFLKDRENQSVTGSEMAKEFGVSRNAIWKAINALNTEGYDIVATKKLGYTLRPNLVKLSADEIKTYMQTDGDVFVFDEVTSTNDVCKKMASDGIAHGSVVVADKQTNGRGRRGRAFYSPQSTGVYMSVALRLKIAPSNSALVTTASAVAVCDAIEELTGKNAVIKWINDIFIDGKKCAGILTEGIFNLDGEGECVIVVGIGVNISTNDFPEEISNIATLIGSVSRNKLVAKIVDNLVKITRNLDKKEHFDRYNEKCFVIGRKVMVLKGEESFFAVAKFVDEEGRLVVETSDGDEIKLYNEEVSTLVE